MTEMILERRFDAPLCREDVLAMAGESAGCFSLYRVGWKQSFLSTDGHRLVCWLSAPDAESVRVALRQADVGEHTVWQCTVHETADRSTPASQSPNVLVERHWDEPVVLDDIQAIEDAGAGCLSTHQVRFALTFFSRDRKRMICLYEAPDAEAVRNAQRQAGMPLDTVWAFLPVLDPT